MRAHRLSPAQQHADRIGREDVERRAMERRGTPAQQRVDLEDHINREHRRRLDCVAEGVAYVPEPYLPQDGTGRLTTPHERNELSVDSTHCSIDS